MIGVGTDIVEVKRVASSAKNKRFMQRVFSKNELIYIESKKNSPETIAGMFSAKEAFSKAIGTGIRGFSLCEVEVLHSELGAPYLSLLGKASEAAGAFKFSLSISHSREYATAVVVAYLTDFSPDTE